MKSLATTFAKDGNFLLNIGPEASGRIPEKSRSILLRIGQWLQKTQEAFFDVTPVSYMLSDENLYLTRREK